MWTYPFVICSGQTTNKSQQQKEKEEGEEDRKAMPQTQWHYEHFAHAAASVFFSHFYFSAMLEKTSICRLTAVSSYLSCLLMLNSLVK